MHITIILGAGESKAFIRCPYPLLNEILEQMLLFTSKHSEHIGNRNSFAQYLSKQRLLLAYALMQALDYPVQKFEHGIIKDDEIDYHFDLISKEVIEKRIGLDKIFELLEKQEARNYESVTRAHWALTHSISFYMLQMYQMYLQEHDSSNFDRAHIELISFIDELLKLKHTVSVVDFNYDCLIESIRSDFAGSTKAKFGWEIGRKRLVLSETDQNVSELIRSGKFIPVPALGEENYPRKAQLIKPHGDMCTFLWGKHGVYYRGVRHSRTTMALFPERLADITEQDNYLRTSIMPPTNSRRRSSSDFYDKELMRFKVTLNESSIFIIIGWSAKGTDQYYDDIFNESFNRKARNPAIFIIDKADTRDRVQELFGNKAEIRELQISGFTQASVLNLRNSIRAEIARGKK